MRMGNYKNGEEGMPLITVITPTYNRADKLPALFASLQAQSSKNFAWLIVDDGSTDDTKMVVSGFAKQADFDVSYIRKENGGKHTALNVGISRIDTELTFIVDSDDTVLPDGIAIIESYSEKYRNDPQIGALAFLRTEVNRGIILRMPEHELAGSYIVERIKKNRPGDMAEVFYTKALREFPFPEFPGEKFLSEDVVWIPLGIKYKMVFINEPIYQFEYLKDGLTRNDKKHKFASPFGSMMRGKMLMHRVCGWRANIRGAIIYDCYKLGTSGNLPESLVLDKFIDKALTVLLLPFGVLFYHIWKNK